MWEICNAWEKYVDKLSQETERKEEDGLGR